MPSVVHDTTRYANNRAEVSHQPTRRRERHMRRFKSVAHAQRFLAVHDVVRNLFTVGRHQLDDKECYLLGASIKDAGARGFVIVPLKDVPVVKFFRDYAEKVCDVARPL